MALAWAGSDDEVTKAVEVKDSAKSPNEEKLRARMGKTDDGHVEKI